MLRRYFLRVVIAVCLLFFKLSFSQFSGISGVGNGINFSNYGDITSNIDQIRPYNSGVSSVTVFIDFWQSGFNGNINLTNATLFYKVNSSSFGTADDGSWTQVNGSLSNVSSSDNDRATFTLSGISAGTDIMFYIRASTTTGGNRTGYAYPGQSNWNTTAPNSQSQTYKIRFNNPNGSNTARLDGLTHEWVPSVSQISNRTTNDGSRTLDMMWDDTWVYFLIPNGFTASNGDRIHIAFDRNSGSGGNANGTTAAFNGATFPENFRPDIIFRARGNGNNSWENDRGVANGSNGWNYSGNIGNSSSSDMWSVSNSNTSNLEIAIRRSAIGTFTSLNFLVYFGNNGDNVYDAYPNGNTATNGLMPIQFGLNNLSTVGTIPVPAIDRFFDGQYNHSSNFDMFGVTNYRNLFISNTGGIISVNTGSSIQLSGNLTISSGGSFTLSNNIGNDLLIRGNWENQGTFNANNRAVFFNGTSPQTIQNDQPAGISIPFLYIQNNVTAISNMTVSNLLNVSGSGIFTNADNKTLTFGSTSTITNNGTIVIQGSLTDNRASKSFGGTVRYEASSGSQTIEGATYNNLELANNSSKTFNADVSISGNFIVSGGSVTTPSNVSFNGSSAQSIAGLAYNNIDFSGAGAKTFTSNASVNPTATITFGSGNSSVDFDGSSNNLTFTLMSDINGTARIANASNWTLTGNVTTERYLPAKRAWRLLASPVKGTTNHSVFANWQNNGTDNGRGLLLWHPSPVGTATPTSSNSGLFVGAQPNIYNYVNGAWTAVTNTNTTYVSTASQNNAFMVFVTGPHASSNFTSTSAVTTSSASGQLITGNVNHNIVANQFTLLGNPYASPINPVSLVSNNSGSKLWMLDPSVGLGAYITYDGNWVPEAPSGNDAYIQSGQGFFVRSTQTNFNIAETDKIAGNSNTWFAKQSVQNTNENKIRVLLDKQINNEWQLADGILSVSGNNYSNEVDAQDALKVTNFNENIQFRNGTNNLAIEYQNLPTAITEQPIRLTGTTATSYRLRVRTEGFVSSDVQPILQDTQSGTNHLITTDGTTIEIPFTGVVSTTNNPDNRFKIVYQQVLGVEQPNYNTLQVYPNPVTQGQFVIALPNSSEVATYEITNYLGQIVQKGNLTAGNTNVSIASQAVGVYLVRVQQNGEVYTTKIVKK